MNIDDILKKHPYLIGGGVLGLIVLFILLRGRTATASPSQSATALDEQNLQLQAALQNQANQQNAQVQAAQIAANAQTSQISAQYNAGVNSTDAALIAALAQNQTQATANNLSAEITNHQNNLEAGIFNNELATQYAAVQNNNQAQLDALHSELAYASAGQTYNQGIINQLIPQLGTHTGNYSQTIAALIASLESPNSSSSTSLANLAAVQSTNNTRAQQSTNSTIAGIFNSLLGAVA